MTLSSVIGFAPAVLLLYILLRRYEGLFLEKYVFILFAVGMVVGMITSVFHMFSEYSLLVLVILFPLFEELAKLVILNNPKLQLKRETVYYGAGLGLGIGSMSIIAIAFRVFIDYPETMGNPQTYFDLVVLSFNFCLLHGATGVIIGYGCSKGEIFNFFFRAYILHAVYNLFFLIYTISGGVWKYGPLFVATLFAIGLFWYVLSGLLPEAVPPDMQKKRRRDLRKRVREKKKIS